MRRYLVVANQTLSSEVLVEKIRTCQAAGPCEFHIVVPATHVAEHLTWTEGHDRVVAGERLASTLERLRQTGATVDGEVGDASPLEAIGDAMRGLEPFDELLLFTLPAGLSRWLHQDLPHRAQRMFALPVTHVVAEPAPA